MDKIKKTQILSLCVDDTAERRKKNIDDLEQLLSMVFDEQSSSSSSSSSTDSDDSEIKQKRQHPCPTFMETIDAYSKEEFKQKMKMKRKTVELLISLFSKSEFHPENYSGKRSKIGCRRTIFIYLWYLCNVVTFADISKLFGVSRSSSWLAVNRVASWLISLGEKYIKWPQGMAVEQSTKLFENKTGIPGVLGAIGSIHIFIKCPRIDKENYYNKKTKSHSLNLQTVFDAEQKIIDISCGEPGSLHAASVLERSELCTTVKSEYKKLFPSKSFILGDSVYPSTSWLVAPFEDDTYTTDLERNFNDTVRAAVRSTVTDAFSVLQGRFPRLLRFHEQSNLMTTTRLIVSACVLHNICILKGDFYTGLCAEPQEQLDESFYEYSDELAEQIFFDSSCVVDRRRVLFNELQERKII